jgi:hypothetical protein
MLMYLYYTHSEEMTQALTAHPALAIKAAALADDLMPSLQAGLKNNTDIAITGKQYKMIITLLAEIRKEAAPRLKNALENVLKKLASPEHLKKIGVIVRH